MTDSNDVAHNEEPEGDGRRQDSAALSRKIMAQIATASSEEAYRDLRDQLWSLGDVAIPTMRHALTSRSTRQRMASACNLGRLGDYASIPDLISLLGDPSSHVREMAIFGLGVLGRPQAIKPIVASLSDYDADVRVRALIALRDLGYSQMESALIQAMRDEAYNVREQAMGYLRTEASPNALHVVLLTLLEPEIKMQAMAEATLDRIIPLSNESHTQALQGRMTPRQVRLVLNYLESRNLHEIWSSLHHALVGLISRPGNQRGIDRYGRILNDESELEFLDQAHLRDEAVSLLVDHFTESDSQRSILLVGPAGSGKTAIVHEVVRRLVDADTGVTVLETNTSELMTNTRYLGEWETKLKEMTSALLEHESETIIYMKNPNDLLGAGAHSKSDESFADFFKPYLERGDVRMIAETTQDLLKGGLSRDPGFLRLFQQVRVEPMSDDDTEEVLKRRIKALRGRGDRAIKAQGDALAQMVDFSRSFYTRSEAPGRACDMLDDVIEYAGRQRAATLAADEALTLLPQDIPAALAEITGLDMALLDDRVPLELPQWRRWFQTRLIAQEPAVEAMLSRVALIKAGMRDPDRPLTTAFLVGPTGVGKTYFARLIAERLFGDAERMVRFDLSEYQGRFAVEKLVGSPHDKDREGLLTEAILQQPYCVLLLDEFEKADPEVYHLFLQVLDEGRLTDARGRTADFRQAIILMTSNLGAARLNPSPLGFDEGHSAGIDGRRKNLDGHIRRRMEEVFQPEFLNRLDDVVVFQPLSSEAIRRLVDLELDRATARRGFRRRHLKVDLTPAARDWIAKRGYSARFGARELKRCIERELLTRISRLLLERRHDNPGTHVHIDVDDTDDLIVRLQDSLPEPPDRDPVESDAATDSPSSPPTRTRTNPELKGA